MSAPDDTHTRLTRLAHRVGGLRPDGRNPEPFYELRSELKAEALAIANGPDLVKRVVKFVPVPAPASEAAPPPEPPAPPAPDYAAIPPGSFPVILNPGEREVIRHATTTTTGGFASAFKRWNRDVDPITGLLVLRPDDLERVWKWGSRDWKGGVQSYTRKAFWRSSGPIFAALGKVPETTDVVAAPNPHRRYSKKPGKGRPGNGQDTPPQNAQDGAGQDSPASASAQPDQALDAPQDDAVAPP